MLLYFHGYDETNIKSLTFTNLDILKPKNYHLDRLSTDEKALQKKTSIIKDIQNEPKMNELQFNRKPTNLIYKIHSVVQCTFRFFVFTKNI